MSRFDNLYAEIDRLSKLVREAQETEKVYYQDSRVLGYLVKHLHYDPRTQTYIMDVRAVERAEPVIQARLKRKLLNDK